MATSINENKKIVNAIEEDLEQLSSYDGDVAKFGTVVSVAGSTIIYAVGSVYIDMHDGSKTIKKCIAF